MDDFKYYFKIIQENDSASEIAAASVDSIDDDLRDRGVREHRIIFVQEVIFYHGTTSVYRKRIAIQ